MDSDSAGVIKTLSQLVEPLAEMMMGCEVVVHDLSRLPNSIVAISGDLTGRKVGDPATDVLLRQAAGGDVTTQINYLSVLPDGRHIRSGTIAVADRTGRTVATLCINCDVEEWRRLLPFCQFMVSGFKSNSQAPISVQDADSKNNAWPDKGCGAEEKSADQPVSDVRPGSPLQEGAEGDQPVDQTLPEAGCLGVQRDKRPAVSYASQGDLPGQTKESFVHNLDDLADLILNRAIDYQGVPVEAMDKNHKKEVIRQARNQGFFYLRDAAGRLAENLHVSRFTVYNYLKELDGESAGGDDLQP